MTFEEWQQKHGPNGGAYDIEMMRAGWDAATRILALLTPQYSKEDG